MKQADTGKLVAGTSVAGACPLLVEAGSLLTGLAIALAFLSVSILSSLSLSLVRRYVRHDLSLPLILLVSVTWVIVLDRLMLACFYELRLALGMYLPLLAMNSLMLMLVQGIAIKYNPLVSFRLVIKPLLLVSLLVVATGGLRELLGQASLLADAHLLPGVSFSGWQVDSPGFTLLQMAPGAFICFAMLLAVVQKCCLLRNNGVVVEQG